MPQCYWHLLWKVQNCLFRYFILKLFHLKVFFIFPDHNFVRKRFQFLKQPVQIPISIPQWVCCQNHKRQFEENYCCWTIEQYNCNFPFHLFRCFFTKKPTGSIQLKCFLWLLCEITSLCSSWQGKDNKLEINIDLASTNKENVLWEHKQVNFLVLSPPILCFTSTAMWHQQKINVIQKLLENGKHTIRNWGIVWQSKACKFLIYGNKIITVGFIDRRQHSIISFSSQPRWHFDVLIYDIRSSSSVKLLLLLRFDFNFDLSMTTTSFVSFSLTRCGIFMGVEERKWRKDERNSNYPIIPFHRAFRNYVGPLPNTSIKLSMNMKTPTENPHPQ